jgi:hypothetical protein
MTANATCVVDDLGPLHRAFWWFFEHASSGYGILARAHYITPGRKESRSAPRAAATIGKNEYDRLEAGVARRFNLPT